MATTISTQDIVDAKRDIDDIGKAVNEKVIVSPRYGEDFKSLPMISAEFQISSDAAEAAAISSAESAVIATSAAQNANLSANIAEAAATAATIGAGVFETPEAGVDPVTGVANGAYFNVRSLSDESYVDEYQNVSGVATATGKSYPSSAALNAVKEAIIDDETGEAVASKLKDNSGLSQQEINDFTYYSKLKGDGSDETSYLQAELAAVVLLNNVHGGINYKATRKGIVITKQVIMPSVTGINIDFTGTTFKFPNGHNSLDSDLFRFNSIKDSIVVGLSLDGNKDNLPDDTSGTGSWIGRCTLLRIGNNSRNCILINTKLNNALYCGSQWGNNIKNITFKNLEFDNIGEQVFYLSGSGGGLVNGVYFDGVLGGNFGVNPNSSLNNHEVAFVKSSNTIGVNDDFQIQNATFKQTSTIPYGTVVCANYDLLRLKLKNITVTDKISALIYPRGRAHYCDIENVYSSETGLTRIVYTHSSNSEVKRYTAKNINLATAAQHHMQVFDYVCDSKLLDIRPTMPTGVAYELDKKCTYERVLFLGRLTNMNNIEFDYNFNECNFQASAGGGAGVLDSIGSASWVDGKYLTFNNCKIPNSTTASYSIATQNPNARLRLLNMPDVIRPLFNRASTTMKLLEIDGAKFPYSGSPLSAVRPDLSILRGLAGYDGSQLRNFLKWSGSVTIAPGSTSNTINLAVAIARPITVQDIHVIPPTLTDGTTYTVSVSANVVTITLNTAAVSNLQFLLKIDVSD